LNVEGNPTPRFIDLIDRVKPDQVTLVPDKPGVLTSDAGWDALAERGFLEEITGKLHEIGCRVSIFVDPDPKMVAGAKAFGADRVELYTGPFAHDFPKNPEVSIRNYVVAAQEADSVGIGLNAGHDLNLKNLAFFCKHIANLLEVSIGHALISDALYFGLQNSIQMYKSRLSD